MNNTVCLWVQDWNVGELWPAEGIIKYELSTRTDRGTFEMNERSIEGCQSWVYKGMMATGRVLVSCSYQRALFLPFHLFSKQGLPALAAGRRGTKEGGQVCGDAGHRGPSVYARYQTGSARKDRWVKGWGHPVSGGSQIKPWRSFYGGSGRG